MIVTPLILALHTEEANARHPGKTQGGAAEEEAQAGTRRGEETYRWSDDRPYALRLTSLS